MNAQQLSRLALRSQAARAKLNLAIREAHSEGISLREIARAVEMSHETVRKIADPGGPRRPGT